MKVEGKVFTGVDIEDIVIIIGDAVHLTQMSVIK